MLSPPASHLLYDGNSWPHPRKALLAIFHRGGSLEYTLDTFVCMCVETGWCQTWDLPAWFQESWDCRCRSPHLSTQIVKTSVVDE